MTLLVRRLGRVAYDEALVLQESLVEGKLAGDPDDYLLLLEHDPVYTLGRGADEQDLQGAPLARGVPVRRVGRGGGVTYHGPGQLVAYPIVALPPTQRDVRSYVARLEQVIMDVCDVMGVAGTRRVGHPGVWVGDAKLASIGVGIRRWVTSHGLSLNLLPQNEPFGAVVACRMPGLRVTSLTEQLQATPSRPTVESLLEVACQRHLGQAATQPRQEHAA